VVDNLSGKVPNNQQNICSIRACSLQTVPRMEMMLRPFESASNSES